MSQVIDCDSLFKLRRVNARLQHVRDWLDTEIARLKEGKRKRERIEALRMHLMDEGRARLDAAERDRNTSSGSGGSLGDGPSHSILS